MTPGQAVSLRQIADRTVERAAGTYQLGAAKLDAAWLRIIADDIEEALRPRTAREIEGDTPPSLWRRMCRRWTRRF